MQKISAGCVCVCAAVTLVILLHFFCCAAFQGLRMYLGCGNDMVVVYALYNRFDDKILRNVG
jgi:hypothetical protein